MINSRLLFLSLCSLLFFCSCSGKPSDKDIEKKILMEYVCAETAKVKDLKISKTNDAESIVGYKGYQYIVSGEVEWKDGCSDYGTRISPGFREKFENKSVTLIKTEEGWQ